MGTQLKAAWVTTIASPLAARTTAPNELYKSCGHESQSPNSCSASVSFARFDI